MGKRGPQPKPTEQKRKLGNPGKTTLPDPATVVPLSPAVQREPMRPLGPAGQDEWDLVWRTCWMWLSESDVPIVQRYAEAMDDYVLVRGQMLAAQADPLTAGDHSWRIRKQVVDADKRVHVLASALGLSPAARAELGVAEVRIAEGVANLMEREPAPVEIDSDDDDFAHLDADTGIVDAEVVDGS